MFTKETYIARRSALKKQLKNGFLFFAGNTEASMNYPDNTYHFRQDSNFLYFFGLDHPNLAGLIDLESGEDLIFGDDVDMDDIVWMGPQPSLSDRAVRVGVEKTYPLNRLAGTIKGALDKGREIHYLPTYRGETQVWISELLGISAEDVNKKYSLEFIKAIVKLRSIKEPNEIREIEVAIDIAWHMHTAAMKMAKPGVNEREIAGFIEGIALSMGAGISFPIILSINGQTLHNHYHGNTLQKGRMMVTDAGAESLLHYASDITRTVPVGGKFNEKQQQIYEIVLKANTEPMKLVKPGITNKSVHLKACEIVAEGLKDLGLMKGNVQEAVSQGAHALFMPHGLGHHMGLDVHDMEGLGENYVGYDEEVKRSDQFGLAFLRFGKKYEPGHVFTIEPGIYFIPELFQMWKSEKKFTEFINYDKVETYLGLGGIRIEDDVLVTPGGYRLLGKPIPKSVKEIEEIMEQ